MNKEKYLKLNEGLNIAELPPWKVSAAQEIPLWPALWSRSRSEPDILGGAGAGKIGRLQLSYMTDGLDFFHLNLGREISEKCNDQEIKCTQLNQRNSYFPASVVEPEPVGAGLFGRSRKIRPGPAPAPRHWGRV